MNRVFLRTFFIALLGSGAAWMVPTSACAEEGDEEWVTVGSLEGAKEDGTLIADGKGELQKALDELEKEKQALAKERLKFEQERLDFAKERFEFEKERGSSIGEKQVVENVPSVSLLEEKPNPVSASGSNETTSSLPKMTRLRVDGRPLGVWKQTAKRTLQSISAMVRNSGDYSAEGINVIAVIPGGKEIPLSGPATLAPGKKAEYTASPSVVVTFAGDINVKPHCENCWK